MTAPGQSYRVAPPLHTEVAHGVDAVLAEATRLAALTEAVPGAPVTARWPWLAASVARPAPGEKPWLVSVAAGSELVAAALLLDAPGGLRRTSLAGTAENHRGALLAVDDHAAEQLGVSLADALSREPREFCLGPISHGPALAALLRALPVALTIQHVAVPIVRTAGTVDSDGMSHGTARTLRKARNRLVADGVVSTVDVTSDGREITATLPLLESICRDRDHAGGRLSPLDDPARRRLWHRRVLALAGSGELRLATLRLDGELAAYVLGIEDGRVYRVLEGRYVARWARYAPGRLLEAATLDAVTDGPFDTFDWMTSVAPETLLAANDLDPLVVVSGRS
jgi:CelD/BcsL family acetyltransferase involved in cellulose biosynthesis